MAQVLFKGTPVKTAGELPKKGAVAPDFKLTKTDLSDTTLSAFKGKTVILNIFPSIGTGTCSASVRQFNKLAAGLKNTVVLAISRDLPFAHKHFCEAEGIANVIPLSEYRNTSFSDKYKVKFLEGGFEGLLSRSIVVVSPDGKVVYTEQVPDTGKEPNYDAALAAAK
jgi:thiol peroxidase